MSQAKEAFEARLTKDFPNLYADMHGDPRVTCMAWGISTGQGWYEIIYELSAKLEKIIVAMPEMLREHVKASQVKEKLGGLRFYMTGSNAEISAAIHEAEAKCYRTCESCGQPGGFCGDGYEGEWLYVACYEHVEPQHKFLFNESGEYIGYPEEH